MRSRTSIPKMSAPRPGPGLSRPSPATILFLSPAKWRRTPYHGLDPRAHVPDYARWGGTEIRKQTEFLINEKLKPALEAAGSSLENAVKAQVYIEKTEDFPDFVEVWNEHFRQDPLCADRSADQVFRLGRRHHRDQSACAEDGATRRKQRNRGGFAWDGGIRPVRAGGRVPFSFGADGGRHGRNGSRRDAIGLTRRTGTCRIYSSVDDLRLRRSTVRESGHLDGNLVRAQYFTHGPARVPRHRGRLDRTIRRHNLIRSSVWTCRPRCPPPLQRSSRISGFTLPDAAEASLSQSETLHLAADLSHIHTDYLWRSAGCWIGYPYYGQPDLYEDCARIAARGKFDLLFFGDSANTSENHGGNIMPRCATGCAGRSMTCCR